MSKVVPRAGAYALHPRRQIPRARIMSEGFLAGGAKRTRAPRESKRSAMLHELDFRGISANETAAMRNPNEPEGGDV
jgi:hypothetical protein